MDGFKVVNFDEIWNFANRSEGWYEDNRARRNALIGRKLWPDQLAG
jgi:hypothetical protein